MNKIILSSSPSSSNDYVVVAVYGEFTKLAYCRPGDDKWTSLGDRRGLEDIIFYKGQLYALHCRGMLFASDIYAPSP